MTDPVRFATPAVFRAWLRKNHESATELLVLLYKKHAADRGLSYADALDDALCYGWIDGVRRGIDTDTFSIRFTPRKPRSIWSLVNVAHVKRLQQAGRMTPAGLTAFQAREAGRTGVYSFERDTMALAPTLEKRFRADKAAWAFFQKQPPGYRKLNMFRVMSARKDETRVRRLDALIALSAKGKKLLIAGLMIVLQAQVAKAQLATSPGAPAPMPTVTSIELRRQSVFDSAEATSWLPRLANRLHVRTRASVVRQELLFRAGQPFDSGLVAESARNLRRLRIFRDVTIDTVTSDSGVVARVTTHDGWTTAIDFSFQSTGSQLTWSTELYESNLLGTNASVLLKHAKDVDRSTSEFEFRRPRLIAHSIGAELYYQDRSDGHQYIVGLSRPFAALGSRSGADVSLQGFGGRLFRFTNGQSVPSDTVERQLTIGRVRAATALRADAGGYLRLGVTAQLRRDDAVAESVGVLPRTITAAIGPSFEWRHARYVLTRSYEHLAVTEDVDLSTTVRGELLAAPRAFGYQHDGIGPSLAVRIGVPLLDGFGFLEARAGGVISATGVDSGTALVGATAIARLGSERQRVVLHVERSWSKGAVVGSDFDLGFGYGPRAFRAHAFTGNRAWLATAEYRYTLTPELGKLAGIAIAAFIDRGGATFAGSRERNGTDAGIGLRIGPTRQADLRTIRIDLARRFANDVEPAGWVIVIGKGFTFRTAL